MKQAILLIFPVITALLTFLSSPLLTGNFIEPTPTSTATPETLLYPISTTAPIPTLAATTPYTLTLDRNELEHIQFIDPNTIVYRKWGDLYIHHLITQTTHLILDGNNIASFDWSPTRQQFVVAKDGQLLLTDRAGNPVEDLSAILAKPDSRFEVRTCQKYNEFMEADSHQTEDAEWSFDETSVQFTYIVLDDCFYSYLWQLNPDTFTLNLLSNSNDFQTWLNDQILVSSAYYGGGSRVFSIVDVPNDRTIFTVDAWGTYPIGSPDGSRVAVAVHDLRKLLVFDTATGQQIFEHNFINKERNENVLISTINLSHSGRYVVVYVTKGTDIDYTDAKYMTVIVDIETGNFWSLPVRSERFPDTIIWLPERDQALMFEQEENITYLSRLLPEIQQIVPIGTITDTVKAPYSWPGNSRYMPLTGQRGFNSNYWGETNAGIWFWDRQKGGLPYLIYLVTPFAQDDDNFRGDASVFDPVLSSDETWLIFGQQIGWGSPSNPYITDTTLQAIHLPSGEHHQIAKWSPSDTQ
ncbi:MAG: hypothetical protein GY928_12965 [Colwellia sp.]|nr:hypothetical protein [Colwellia sp.]